MVSLLLMLKMMERNREEELTQFHHSQCCSSISSLIVSVHIVTTRTWSAPCVKPKKCGQRDNQSEVKDQRREDMTSRRSYNLDALITFQGQESRMQATRMALWTKSRWALSVFY